MKNLQEHHHPWQLCSYLVILQNIQLVNHLIIQLTRPLMNSLFYQQHILLLIQVRSNQLYQVSLQPCFHHSNLQRYQHLNHLIVEPQHQFIPPLFPVLSLLHSHPLTQARVLPCVHHLFLASLRLWFQLRVQVTALQSIHQSHQALSLFHFLLMTQVQIHPWLQLYSLHHTHPGFLRRVQLQFQQFFLLRLQAQDHLTLQLFFVPLILPLILLVHLLHYLHLIHLVYHHHHIQLLIQHLLL